MPPSPLNFLPQQKAGTKKFMPHFRGDKYPGAVFFNRTTLSQLLLNCGGKRSSTPKLLPREGVAHASPERSDGKRFPQRGHEPNGTSLGITNARPESRRKWVVIHFQYLRYNSYLRLSGGFGARKMRAIKQSYRRPLACSTPSPTGGKFIQIALKEVPFEI